MTIYLKVAVFGLVFLAISALVFVGVSVPPKIELLENQNAAFILPENLDEKVFSLDGSWGFRHGGFYSPQEMAEADTVTLPSPWEDDGYPTYGSGSYFVTIDSPKEQTLMLYLPEILSAYELYVNDTLLDSSGVLPTAENVAVENLKNELVSIPLNQGENRLLFWVTNENINGSGLFYSILIGEEEQVLSYFFLQRAKSTVVLGAFLLIGMYFLILFAFRRKQKEYLVLGLICLNVFLRFLGDSNNLLQYFQPFPLDDIYVRATFLLYALNVCLLCIFTNIPLVIGMVRAVLSREIREQPFLLLYLFSLVMYVGFGGIAKIVAGEHLFAAGVTASVFMLLVQSTLLADRYSYAMNRIETENLRLEHTVEERTAEVNAANAQLMRSQEALKEMLQGISHDLKTPVTILSQYLELLKLEVVPKTLDEQKQYIEIAYRKDLDIQRLIKRLFEVARMEMGETPLKLEWLPLSQLEQEFQSSYATMLEEKQITLEMYSPSGVEVFTDHNRISSIMDNLVYNAMRHTPEHGRITLQAEPTATGMVFSVSDTGGGIAAEHLPYIFDRFYKASKSREEKEGDSGLRLYIVKKMLEQMQSEVTVESIVGEVRLLALCCPFGRLWGELKLAYAQSAFRLLYFRNDFVWFLPLLPYLIGYGQILGNEI